MNHNQTPDEWSQLNVRMAVFASQNDPFSDLTPTLAGLQGQQILRMKPHNPAHRKMLRRSGCVGALYAALNIPG